MNPIITYIRRDKTRYKSEKNNFGDKQTILRTIIQKTCRDHDTSENIRRILAESNMNMWTKQGKEGWNRHISRMNEERIVRIVRDQLLRTGS